MAGWSRCRARRPESARAENPHLERLAVIDPIQVLSLLGALLQLLAYALMQLGRLPSQSLGYQGANVIGSLLMTIVAAINHELGFLLMETVWCLTSAYGLMRLLRSQRGASHSA